MARRAKRASRPNPREDRNTAQVIQLKNIQTKRKKIEIIPKSENQEDYLLALENESKSIVFATGPAGTGKTMLATLWAIKEYQAGNCDKIVITRPNVAVDDKDIGYLPGDIFAKLMPWCMPILDVFKEYFSIDEVKTMIEEEIIELVPIAFIRGRTFKHSIVIVDESQNTTINSMLSILTRIGEGSKMVVTGDVKQSDRGKDNGLNDFLGKVANNPNLEHIEVVRFDYRDIQRHPAVREILKLYKEE